MKLFPKIIPVFPLSGVIYFPKTKLPLNIFEQRYLDLVNDTYKKDKLMPKLRDLKTFQDSKIFKKKVMLILSMQGTSPIVAGSGTSGDGFIKMTGAINVFESFEGWKPVSEEAIIESDPDYFIIPSRDMHKGSNVKSLTSNPIFKNTKAGSKENFIFEDSMAMLGFGPRTIKTALKVAKEMHQQD